jgi:Kdo2-lipid IVA lauroyltransferase/acyltransferase
MKRARYILEAILLCVLMTIFRLMPAQTASNAGGWVGRAVGPRLAASRKALRNIERALPGLSPAEQQDTLRQMWDNLGRVMAEYPHLETLARDHTEVIGMEHLHEALASGHGAILVSAHLGNWEIGGAAFSLQIDTPIGVGYRAPNNPWAGRWLLRARSLNGRIKTYSKSRAGGRQMIESLKKGDVLGLLVDQKYNEGLEIPFFGLPATINPFFAQVALKYGAPILPAFCERLGGARFRLTLLAPLDTHEKSVEQICAESNALIERQIRARPGQWLWLHRRWKDER